MAASHVDVAFVYGSLLADEVLERLLGRVPLGASAAVDGYHRYSLKSEIYPAVAPRSGSRVIGKALFGLTEREMKIFDDFEDIQYVRTLVEPVLLDTVPSEAVLIGQKENLPTILAYMYVWANHDDPNLYGDWNYEEWRKTHLEDYVDLCGEFIGYWKVENKVENNTL